MAVPKTLAISISSEIQANYDSELFEDDNLILEILPESYRVLNSGVDWEIFEGIQSDAVLKKATRYQFGVTTISTSSTLGLILQDLVDSISATPGTIAPITVYDALHYAPAYVIDGYQSRQVLMKFNAVSGLLATLTGTARPGGYAIEFTEIR